MTDFLSVVGAVFGLGLFGVAIWLHRKAHTRSRRNLQRWVENQGCRLITAKRAWLRKGPYLVSGRGQVIFRITILDKQAQERTGWVRCGSLFKGAAFSDAIEGVLDQAA